MGWGSLRKEHYRRGIHNASHSRKEVRDPDLDLLECQMLPRSLGGWDLRFLPLGSNDLLLQLSFTPPPPSRLCDATAPPPPSA